MTMDTATARARLEALKAELLALSESAKDDRKPVELDQQSVGRLSRQDSLQVQAMMKAADARRATEIRGEAIAPKRLEADPAAPRCAECA